MRIATFDIEADALLDKVTFITALVVKELDGDLHSFASQPGYKSIQEGLAFMQTFDKLIAHNGIGYDVPTILKLYKIDFHDKCHDTLLEAQLAHHNAYSITVKSFRHIDKKLWMRHSLEAWGARVGVKKSDFGKTADWGTWSEELQRYCEQDVIANEAVYKYLVKQRVPPKALKLEMDFKRVITEQEIHGVSFDAEKAEALYKEVSTDVESLHKELTEEIPAWVTETPFTPKVNSPKFGYVKGVATIKRKTTIFNPGSRDQIHKYLNQKYRWVSPAKTDSGKPQVTDEILRNLPYEEADKFADYLIKKALVGKLGTAKGAWLKLNDNGKIYGSVNTLGAQSHRVTHSKPNLSQVPSPRKYKGNECRSLFYAPKGYKFVGCDASGIQLRMLGHFLHDYDNGAYATEVEEGDIHTKNQRDAGLETRDVAKTFIYAFLFGAGGELLGSLVAPKKSLQYQKMVGNQAKSAFMSRNPAISKLIATVSRAFEKKGWVKGTDGRKLVPSSGHTALNTVIQNAEAVLMKRACVMAREKIIEEGIDARQVLFIHDEIQYVAKEGSEERVAEILEWSIAAASAEIGYNVKNVGEAKIGENWYDCH